MNRTIKQNASLHVYIRILAEALDAAGYDMRTLIKVPIKPTEQNVKTEMIHPIMRALYPDVDSTSELSTTEIQTLYEVCNRATAEKLGISIEFPSEENHGNLSQRN